MERISFNDLPDGFYAAMLQIEKVIESSGLDFKMLELMRTRVSQINGCAHCLEMHFKESVAAGENPLRLVSVSAWREAPYYSGEECALLAFAERLTIMPESESNEDIHDELKKYFNRDEIAYLSLAVAQINSWNRLVKSFGPATGNYQPRKQHHA